MRDNTFELRHEKIALFILYQFVESATFLCGIIIIQLFVCGIKKSATCTCCFLFYLHRFLLKIERRFILEWCLSQVVELENGVSNNLNQKCSH